MWKIYWKCKSLWKKIKRHVRNFLGYFRKSQHSIVDAARAGEVCDHIYQINLLLKPLKQEDWTEENIKNALWDYATQKGRSQVLNHSFRYPLSGLKKSPNGLEIAYIIGKRETYNRLKEYQQFLADEFGGGYNPYKDDY